VILDAVSGKEVTEKNEEGNLKGVLAIKQPWPGECNF
jgi:hypothetical protein